MTNCHSTDLAEFNESDFWRRKVSQLFSTLPEDARTFLTGDLETGADRDLDLGELVQFWNKHRDRKWRPNNTWHLAIEFCENTDHSYEGMPEANNLLLCAALLQEAFEFDDMGKFLDKFMEHHAKVVALRKRRRKGFVPPVEYKDEIYRMAARRAFPCLYEAYMIRDDPARIEDFLDKRKSVLPWALDATGSVDPHRDHKTGKDGTKKEKEEEYTIKFVEEDGCGGKESVKMPNTNILQSTKFKQVINQYTEIMGVSPRFLRLSFKGKMLFLSTMGSLTPIQLGMEPDKVNTIFVTDLSRANKKEGDEVGSSSSLASKQNKKRTKKGQQQRKRKPKQQSHAVEKTTEEDLKELKIEHSKRLTKIYDEAQPQMKLIRQRLNNLLIEKRPQKAKSAFHSNRTPLATQPIFHNIPSECLRGKAGKSQYTIHVGEVANLYKSSKRKHKAASVSEQQRQPLAIDLHGLRRDEAVQALDESLLGWNDAAMSGAYPFVVPVRIICGGGGQVLSEVVERWIQCNDRVANAPKKV